MNGDGTSGSQGGMSATPALALSEASAELTAALLPNVERAISDSIRRDPQLLADSMFPIMGPAIRKSIAAALQALTQSIDQTLEHSFSPKGLRWRIEALRTGRPFAEIVLRHTLLYRVEQVFLIDRRAGLLMQHVAAPQVLVQDTGMVSGMLTAIQDFVRDSFGVTERDTLDTLQVGECVVWIEAGPLASLAGVIRGTPPQTVRDIFRRAVERIHQQHGAALAAFDGDAAALEAVRPQLEGCLDARYDQQGASEGGAAPGGGGKARRVSPLVVIVGVLAAAIALAIALHLRQVLRWERYVERLRSEPGIVVTHAQAGGGGWRIAGLRDALAADPGELLQAAGLDAHDVQFAWEPFLSLQPQLVQRRAQARLAPPAGVQLHLQGQMLVAEGVAPRAWLRRAVREARTLPGVVGLDASRAKAAEDAEWQALRQRIEARALLPLEGGTQLAPGQDEALAGLGADLRRLGELAQGNGVRARLEIVGRADGRGSDRAALRLSQARADALLRTLAAHGVPQLELVAVGLGARQPLRPGHTLEDREHNRKLRFNAELPAADPAVYPSE